MTTNLRQRVFGCAGGMWLLCCSAALADPATAVTINDTGVFPESVTSNAAGDLFVGSSAKGTIYRARSGEADASPWIEPQTSGMSAVLGVFADDRSNTLYACSVAFGAPPDKAAALSALRAFDLKTGAPKAAYPLPEGSKSLCNDIAVGKDGSAYVSETSGGRILRLKKGGAALQEWIKDERLAGVDGIALGGDGAVYVNSVSSGRMFRVAVGKDGSAGAITELTPSLKLNRPDGLRSIGGLRFLQAEGGAGRISELVISGDQTTVVPLKSGEPGLTAVTVARGKAWAVNAKFAYRSDPALKDKDPNPFTVEAIDLPGR